MPTYAQTDQPMSVITPLDKDVLLLTGFTGNEGISELFHFSANLLAENSDSVPFEALIGQKLTIELKGTGTEKRYFNGIVNRISQGGRDSTFTEYQVEIVPQFWLLSKKIQSRVFQHLSIPDILKAVLKGLDVAFEIKGAFEPRDYCVQYQESDFSFASRLMEEEGIFYFFKHSLGGHKMVLANSASYPDVNPSKIIYEEWDGGIRSEDRITGWQKTQELRSGKVTLWDYSLELPNKHLEADKTIADSVQVGVVTHKLKLAGNDQLEIFEFPGGYAERFDGVDPGGGDKASDLKKIFDDNKRTVELRMQAEASESILITGSSSCRQFVSGHRFSLDRHYNADGDYVLTSIQHMGRLTGNYRSGEAPALEYSNSFACLPVALPYRPQRKTAVPRMNGTQTASVVGPAGEEIFPDKYGRVKVQFQWDRQGKKDADSSCWVRVATTWAGTNWGGIHIPRIGQEVVVAFEEGDVNRPVIVGSLYNAEQMPPYKLPDNKSQSGVKSNTYRGGGSNEIRMEDKSGSEELYIHAQKDQNIKVENDEGHEIVRDRTFKIGRDETKTITRDQTLTITNGNQKIKISLGKSEEEALQSIELKVGQSSVKLDQTGVTIKGLNITVEGQVMTQVKGLMTQVNASAILTLKGGLTTIN